jgi:thiosulfate dehydrogenase
VKTTRYIVSGICITALIGVGYFFSHQEENLPAVEEKEDATEQLWVGPDPEAIDITTDSGKLIAYGRELIANTASYLGPKGSVMQVTNGMNCQNCHLEAGTKPWGNNYGAVYTTYPKFRNRSGTVENIYKRINDCLQRSLNGQVLDTTSREVMALYAYFKWLGSGVPRGVVPAGAGLESLPYLDRPADSVRGKAIYVAKCQLCHGPDGKGQFNPDGATYLYPPLWGENSYTTAAGLYRLGRFAGYAYNNMPFGATWQARQLTVEEAWDVAAFVNSQSRPVRTFIEDWPDISKKPLDHPFGPYADGFSEGQHRFGPFGPIAAAREARAKK